MELLTTFFDFINSITWGYTLVPLLLVIGIFITLATGFVQLRYFRDMFTVLFPQSSQLPSSPNKHQNAKALSSLSVLLVSIGGRVGGGNIAGVAVAITLGGPGAVFWMWAVAGGSDCLPR